MSKPVSRRKFLKKSVLGSMAALAASHEEKALLARGAGPEAASGGKGPEKSAGRFPTGKIGNLQVSRVICGGNLISGFAHSRDLIYVSPLLRQYFTDEKVFETLELCEENGINTAILRVDGHITGLLQKYRSERGGKIQWIAQAKMNEKDLGGDIEKAIENGAVAVYIHGGVCDSFVEKGQVELLGKALEIIRKGGVPAGLAGHALATLKGFQKAGLDPDFYMKTLNEKSYWSAGLQPRHDSVWSETPRDTIEFMKKIEKPWIAYKILGAGAIHPGEGFRYAFENGADFTCVGMFDFQVLEDVIIARKTLANLHRTRPWRG